MAGFLKGGKFKPVTANASTEETNTTVAAPTIEGKPSPFKKKLGGLKKKEEPKELDLDKQEDLIAQEPAEEVAAKPSLGKKKLGGFKKKEELQKEVDEAAEKLVEAQTEGDIPVELTPEQEATIAAKEDLIAEAELCGNVIDEETKATPETKEEPKVEEVPVVEEKKTKKRTRKKATTTKADESGNTETAGTMTIRVPEVDETKRVSVEEMDAAMRPIVAPTTASWEQEKKDVLAALKEIMVEQDMSMAEVKHAFAELDSLNFEILPKRHDAATLYDGTKQNYETVKAIAIAKGVGTNAEARKAEGILACKNYVTPSGQVVDLNQYMLLIEERNKFYQKIVESIDFKKYSLVNYNNALKTEANN